MALAALLVASGPGPAAATPVPGAALLAADAAFDASLAARDPDTFTAHVAEDAVFSGRKLLLGRAAVAAHWARYLDPEGPTLRWKPTDAGVAASGDLGWTIGDARYTWGKKGIDQEGLRYLTVWRKSAGGRWEAVLDGSLVPPPPGASTRKPVRTFKSSDGSMRATIGTYRRSTGGRETSGIYIVVRSRLDGAWRTVLDSEMQSG